MPETLHIPPTIIPLVDAVREDPGEYTLRTWKAMEILKETGALPEEIVGYGRDNLIMADPRRRDIVHAINFHGERARRDCLEVFALNAALCILFPHNFPKFRSIWPHIRKFDRDFSGSVRGRIWPAPVETPVVYPFSAVLEFQAEAKYLPLNIDLDKPDNIRLGLDGGEYYVDEVTTYNFDRVQPGHVKAVEKWMQTHCVVDKETTISRPFSGVEIARVSQLLQTVM